jgi:hypothetical protein
MESPHVERLLQEVLTQTKEANNKLDRFAERLTRVEERAKLSHAPIELRIGKLEETVKSNTERITRQELNWVKVSVYASVGAAIAAVAMQLASKLIL